ncbi:hypothetical protein GCM10010195_53900 [Kitasatospora griseola]|nr:hypothetical protein GCM10010195_53900 [Kitasatospora griseola]
MAALQDAAVEDADAHPHAREQVDDTASYSDIVFGLLTLAGFAYAPQLADLPGGLRPLRDKNAADGA